MAVSRSVKIHRQVQRWKRDVLGCVLVLFGMALALVSIWSSVTLFAVTGPVTLIIFGACVMLDIPLPTLVVIRKGKSP